MDARWTRQRKERLWASRVTLTEELVARIAAAKQKPAVLLSGSAIGYYGDCGALRIDESASAGKDFGALLCAAWESAAMRASESGVRICLLRTGLVLSNNGGMLAKMRFALPRSRPPKPPAVCPGCLQEGKSPSQPHAYAR